MSGQLFFQRAYSAQLDPWTSLISLYNPTFQKDFCHQNDLTLQVTSHSFNHSKIRVKETFNIQDKRINLNDEMRICIPIRNDSTLYGRLQNNNVRVQYDHGIRIWKKLVYNLYSSMNISKNNTSSTNLQFGGTVLSRIYTIDNLFKLSNNYVRWYHKTMLKLNDFRFGLVSVMDFNTSNFIKKDFLMGYNNERFQFYAHAYQGWNQLKFESQYFSHYKLMLFYKQNTKSTLGIQTVLSKDLRSIQSVEGVIQHKFNQKNKIKIKLTNKFNITLLLKNQWNQYLNTSAGYQLAMSANKIDKSKLGFKIEVNV